MFHPLREGIDAGSGEGQAVIHPPGWNPLIEELTLIRSSNDLLLRIATALENRAAENDAILYIPPGKADGTIKAQQGPRLRCKWLYISPIGTGEPVLTIGTQNFYVGSIQAIPVPIIIPFPRVVDVGVDIFLWDNSAPTTVPDFVGYIMGTTE